MLVLSRKEGERLVIGGKIVVTICRISPNKVRVGIEAPSEFDVSRSELLTRPRWCKTPENYTCLGVLSSQPEHQQAEHCERCPYCNKVLLPESRASSH